MATEKIILDIQAQVADAQKRIQGLEKGVKGVNKEVGKTDKLFAKAGATLAAFFSVQAIAGFTKQIITVRAEFEKYEAVLKNTLGTARAARKEFDMIREFAAETPFQVIELTNSFVKLVNQGFRPTREELRKLGDLAASTGKSFDQLAEAIIDATVGEFERLKEFGIRAKKSGDQVTFTFKEVEKQVKFTSDAIREYILSLGDLQGVSGAMAEISETLGGKISNLKDSWETLLDTMGSKTTGVMSRVIAMLKDMIETITINISEDKGPVDIATERFENLVEAIAELPNEEQRAKVVERILLLKQSIDITAQQIDELKKSIKPSGNFKKFAEETHQTKATIESLTGVISTNRNEISLLEGELNNLILALLDTDDAIIEVKTGLEALSEADFKKLIKQAKDSGAEEDEGGILESWMFPDGFDETSKRLKDQMKEIADESWKIYKQTADRKTADNLKQNQEEDDINRKFADAAVQIELWKQETKIIAAQQGFSALMQVTSENAVLQKVLAIAESIVSTYLTAQYAAQSQAAIPIVGPILAEAARAQAITSGWINTALIAAVSIAESFEEGGFTGSSKYGFRDAKGKRIAGVVHENEFVFPEKTTRELRPLFEDIHSGRIDARGLAALTKRGVIIPLTNNEFNSSVLEREVGKIYGKMQEKEPERWIQKTDKGYIKKVGNTIYNVKS